MSGILTLFVWALFALDVNAVSYRYVLTYATTNFICHADFEITPYSDPSDNPLITTNSIYCVLANEENGATFDIPAHSEESPNGAVIYTTSLGPMNQRGHYGVEIGINRPAYTFANNVHLPAVNPRVNFYFDFHARPLGACNYRQGAEQLAQTNGERIQPYNCPSTSRVGRRAACIVPCTKFW
ncbi:hypothetical protein C8035_v001863 [Colletotrichum spinosum]|uniref:Secreted protein n=1 Tax=Colletotrichum spinosum TaxID=1347390 RepID=A0A4V3HRG7_9PEZI|nr:hypothetical protein C8035_v001863 [Colletotrichum spinosum]